MLIISVVFLKGKEENFNLFFRNGVREFKKLGNFIGCIFLFLNFF